MGGALEFNLTVCAVSQVSFSFLIRLLLVHVYSEKWKLGSVSLGQSKMTRFQRPCISLPELCAIDRYVLKGIYPFIFGNFQRAVLP